LYIVVNAYGEGRAIDIAIYDVEIVGAAIGYIDNRVALLFMSIDY